MGRRLALARRELAAIRHFDYAVVNDELERAIAEVQAILEAERSGQSQAARARHGRAAVLQRLGRPFDELV